MHIGFKTLSALKRGETGRTLLQTHKDRPGFLPRPTLGVLELVSDGENVSYTLANDRSHAGDKFRPTHQMERVSAYLASQDGAVSKNHVETNVSGKAAGIRTAIDVLVDEGYAREKDGPNRARLVEHVRPYEQADDAYEAEDSGSSPFRPRFVPSLRSTLHSQFVPSSPFLGDEDELGARVRPDEQGRTPHVSLVNAGLDVGDGTARLAWLDEVIDVDSEEATA